MKKIKSVVFAITNDHDWIDESGKPYLVVAGAEKVGRIFGVSWRIDEPKTEMLEGGHYNITYKGFFSLGSASIEVIGTRSSRDPFFSKRGDEVVPIQEIDKNDVLKGALTNCIGNGVTRILGIRNLTWEEIRGAGITKEGSKKIDRGVTPEKVTKMRTDIRDMLLEMNDQNKDEAAKQLEEITAWTTKEGKQVAGKKVIADLTDKQVPVIYGKIQEVFNEWLDKRASGSGQSETPPPEGS
jgi:hypothetical protein